jgi:hypothetical protein
MCWSLELDAIKVNLMNRQYVSMPLYMLIVEIICFIMAYYLTACCSMDTHINLTVTGLTLLPTSHILLLAMTTYKQLKETLTASFKAALTA